MNNMLQLFIGAWLHPWQTMRMVGEQPQETSIKSSVLYLFLIGLINSAIIAIFPEPQWTVFGIPRWGQALLIFIISFVFSFVGAVMIWGFVTGFVRGTLAEYKTTYRLLAVLGAFYPVMLLLVQIPVAGPWLGWGVRLWTLAVLVGGVSIVLNTSRVRTIVTFAVVVLLYAALTAMAFLGAQAQSGRPFAGGGDFGGNDFDLKDDEELDAQLDELIDKQKAAATPSKKEK